MQAAHSAHSAHSLIAPSLAGGLRRGDQSSPGAPGSITTEFIDYPMTKIWTLSSKAVPAGSLMPKNCVHFLCCQSSVFDFSRQIPLGGTAGCVTSCPGQLRSAWLVICKAQPSLPLFAPHFHLLTSHTILSPTYPRLPHSRLTHHPNPTNHILRQHVHRRSWSSRPPVPLDPPLHGSRRKHARDPGRSLCHQL